jgi:hypothetical protein
LGEERVSYLCPWLKQHSQRVRREGSVLMLLIPVLSNVTVILEHHQKKYRQQKQSAKPHHTWGEL